MTALSFRGRLQGTRPIFSLSLGTTLIKTESSGETLLWTFQRAWDPEPVKGCTPVGMQDVSQDGVDAGGNPKTKKPTFTLESLCLKCFHKNYSNKTYCVVISKTQFCLKQDRLCCTANAAFNHRNPKAPWKLEIRLFQASSHICIISMKSFD